MLQQQLSQQQWVQAHRASLRTPQLLPPLLLRHPLLMQPRIHQQDQVVAQVLAPSNSSSSPTSRRQRQQHLQLQRATLCPA
jgi:hypothetical protein